MKLVILDRDGTINEDRDDYVKSPAQWLPLPGALEAIARLNHAGWHVVVATNQSGIGRGLFDMETLNAMHSKMHSMLAAVGGRVDAVFFCPHTPADACDCRKPASGLFRRIGERDAVAALAAGCVPHLVRTGKSQGLPEGGLPEGCPPGCQSHADLAAFVDTLIGSGA